MSEEELEFKKQEVDEKLGEWLTAHGISHDVQGDMDYSDYDDAIEALLQQGKEEMQK